MHDTMALLLVWTQLLLIVTSVVFLVSGLDDVFVEGLCDQDKARYIRTFV